MLKIDGLKVSYGGIEAVKGITFEVPERKIVTLIGANGAGKSTTLRTIAGLVKPAKGRIHLQGEVVVTRRGLDDLESAIDSRDFLRCHRSSLINMNYVRGLEGNDFRMTDNSLIPISSSNISAVRSKFIDWTYLKAWEQA